MATASEDVKPFSTDAMAAPVGSMDGLSEYEQQRLEHIRRNQEFMARLGIPTTLSTMETIKAPKPRTLKPANAKIEFAPEDLRRSARVVGKAPDYTGEFIDGLGDDDVKTTRKRPRTESTSEEKEQELRELLDNSRRWLKESRDVLLKVTLVF